MSTWDKLGHGAAKVLDIKLDYRNETGTGTNLTRGESVFSVDTADSYVETEPSSLEWIQSITPSRREWLTYLRNLFPFTRWIGKYNLQWLQGDLVAGITIGAIVVPQGMAYAKLAELPVEFGLYSSFMGVLIYWFFATSKDITIGPVAVMSTITGNVVLAAAKTDPTIAGHVVASALALVCGAIVCFIGLIRLGWIIDIISLASIAAFMTGAALNVGVGQIPTLMGITVENSRGPTYNVIIDSLKGLPTTTLDAAIGLTALAMLYLMRFSFNFLAKRQPNRRKLWFFCNTLRSVFVILLYVLISYLCNIHTPRTTDGAKKSPFKILGPVPRGFQDAGVPVINIKIIKLFVKQLPASVIVLLIEHISIAKSFGRINNYTINPSQEMVAIGVTNLLAPFLGGFPSTGSFSRTAVKSKAGVRTPFAGVITAVVVLLAIYALTAVFFYIPSASLSAVIIHAVFDLITPPNTVYQFWRISPLEVIIFFAGVLVTVFTTIENGIYTTVCISFALFLFRTFKAQGRFLGRVKVHSVVGDHHLEGSDGKYSPEGAQQTPGNDPDKSTRNIFLPIDHGDGSNPSVQAEHPYPGVFIYRFSEGYNFPNANHYLDFMVRNVFQVCRRTNLQTYGRLGDRPWNDPGPSRRNKLPEVEDNRPTLKAVILDFSSVNNVDITSVQHLIDVRNQLDRYAAPHKVQWHFACINNRWTKRALVSAGFGYPTPEDDEFHRFKPIFSVAEQGGLESPASAAEREDNKRRARQESGDLESGQREIDSIGSSEQGRTSFDKQIRASSAYAKDTSNVKVAVVQGLNRPFFHIDLTSALQSAINYSELIRSKEDNKVVAEEDSGDLKA